MIIIEGGGLLLHGVEGAALLLDLQGDAARFLRRRDREQLPVEDAQRQSKAVCQKSEESVERRAKRDGLLEVDVVDHVALA